MVPLVVFSVAALLLWVIAAVLMARVAASRKGAVRVRGTVTGARQFVDRGRTMFVATYEARTPSGDIVHGVSSTAKSWEPTAGQSVSLLFNPGNADEPLVETGLLPMLPSLLVGAFALGLTVFCGAILIAILTPPENGATSRPASHAPTLHERRHH